MSERRQDDWTTSISRIERDHLELRGYPVEQVIQHLGHAGVIWLLCRPELPTPAQEAALDAILASCVDQQFGNTAACVTRFVASVGGDSLLGAVAAGILAHGTTQGSPKPCAEFLLHTCEVAASAPCSDEVAVKTVVQDYLARGERVPGFGHLIHREREPRTAGLRPKLLDLGVLGRHVALLDAVEAQLQDSGRPLLANHAGFLAAAMLDLGFAPTEIELLLAVNDGFAMVAHALEEARGGAGVRIIDSSMGAAYVGHETRDIHGFDRHSRAG